jgi:hypothetical protein
MEVSVVMGNSSREGEDWEEFKLDGGDLMNVWYDSQDYVNTIQLYFTHPAHAPKWVEVVGDAEIREKSNGLKYARAMNKEEKSWVMMLQSRSGAITTITLSRLTTDDEKSWGLGSLSIANPLSRERALRAIKIIVV